MGLNMQSHTWVKDSRTGQMVVGRVNHYADLSENGQRVILQDGKVYYPNGKELKGSEIPTWVQKQVDMMPDSLKRNIGWTAAEKPRKSSSAAPTEPASAEPETQNPREMKFFALRAWAKREHDIEGEGREEILAKLEQAGILEPE